MLWLITKTPAHDIGTSRHLQPRLVSHTGTIVPYCVLRSMSTHAHSFHALPGEFLRV